MNSSTTTLWAGLFPIAGCLLCFILIVEVPIFNANSVDPDQMPHSVASDLGLHCLSIKLGDLLTKMGKNEKCFPGEVRKENYLLLLYRVLDKRAIQINICFISL